MEEREVDVLIVGGGIVGSGIARDAAMRGLSTVLVEQHDFAFGTSSRSSRLLHGGMRYLAQGRIGLVREASTEKMTLARIAPHLAQPLPFLFPTFKGSGWKKWKLRVGVKMYDWLCGKANLGRSGGLSKEEMLQSLPGLRTEGLTGGVRYFDGFTNDARLVIDSLLSAAAHGGTLLNYTSLVKAEPGAGGWTCRLSGPTVGGEVTVKARVVVNAAGAWAEQFPQSEVKLRLTKGVHLVVERSRLPVPDAVVMTEGTRILFAIPWGERVILGTTDSDYDGPIDNPTCERADMEYVLRIVNENFPKAELRDPDVISAWAGLRPLIANPNGKPSDISRAHEIHVSKEGWIDVAGGKLTTYRLMAEQTVDHAAKLLGKTGTTCRTAEEPIASSGGAGTWSGVVPPELSREAVEHFCTREWARHLDDVMIRRAGWHYYHRDAAQIARRVAEWMAAALEWPADRTAAELERYREMTRSLAPAWIEPAEEQGLARVDH
jgi:glycerol-3-phosphate dehydrogenase